MSYLTDYEEIDGGYVAFGGNPKGGKITRKEAVSTACYVQNRVLVVKPHNKTPYELFHGRTPTFHFMKPFGCLVTILSSIDHLGKFDGKANKGFFRYSLNSKAFRVFNSRTSIVEENLHIRFSESTPNVVGGGPDCLFDIDALTRTMNYEPIIAGTQSNGFAGRKSSRDDGSKPLSNYENKVDEDPRKKANVKIKRRKIMLTTLTIDDEDDGAVVDMNNLDRTIQVSAIPTKRIHKYHPLDQVIGDLQSATKQERYDIIFGLTKKELCIAFERLMHEKFQMSSMGELTFFLGLQVKQKKDGIFISQDKYVAKFFKKFGFAEVKTASTSMETQKPLLKNEDGEEVDVHMHRSMIGSLMYLTSSRPVIMFAVCACENLIY
nr:uncharacterized mitochondrial protein AtMg00810-like [Tanacetum cinerariifolium]